MLPPTPLLRQFVAWSPRKPVHHAAHAPNNKQHREKGKLKGNVGNHGRPEQRDQQRRKTNSTTQPPPRPTNPPTQRPPSCSPTGPWAPSPRRWRCKKPPLKKSRTSRPSADSSVGADRGCRSSQSGPARRPPTPAC